MENPFNETSDQGFSRKKLNSDEIANAIGIMSSFYLVKSTGGREYDPKGHNDVKQHNIGSQSPINSNDSRLQDFDFVEEIDNWESWSAKAGPSEKKKRKPEAEFHYHGDFDYLTCDHDASSEPARKSLEDATYVWEILAHSPEYINSTTSLWKGTAYEPKQFFRSTAFGTGTGYRSDSAKHEDKVHEGNYSCSAGLSSLAGSVASNEVHDTQKWNVNLVSVPDEMSSTSDDCYYPPCGMWSDSTDDCHSVQCGEEIASDLEERFESDEDYESEKSYCSH